MQKPNGNGRAEADYDVVVIGGAFSGAASAILLKRWMPEAKILVIERETAFDQKVGEATVEVSSLFLHRVLGVYDELSRVHLPKHGLRYWFHDTLGRRLSEMSEVGPDEVPRLPSFQLDRAKLDEHLLSVAKAEGALVARPARVTDIELEWPKNRIRFEQDGTPREVTSRWVIDASGRSTLVARQLGLHSRTAEHPTAALWGRWSNIRDMDGVAMTGPDPRQPKLKQLSAARRLATNHFCGYGFWCWVIPLGGGETSIGLVYNKELFDPKAGNSALESYRNFLETQPGLREIIQGARLNEDDFRRYSHLPYKTTKYAGRGWALVGDAASFMDPYYSPGLDHAAMSVYATARILEADLRTKESESLIDARLATHNDEFVRSYDRWLSAIYLGKYELMGDAELTATAFLLDIALYYLGVVRPVFKDIDNLKNPVLGQSLPQAKLAYGFMRFYNERLVALARKRRAQGTYGKKNAGTQVYFGDVGLGWSTARRLIRGLRMWGRLEIDAALDGRGIASGHGQASNGVMPQRPEPAPSNARGSRLARVFVPSKSGLAGEGN
jgi:flavin-dependent dehydrogenase